MDRDEHEIKHATREEWMDSLVEKMRGTFEEAGRALPEVKCSAGFPPRGGLAPKTRTRGCCMFGPDGSAHVFVSPLEDLPGDVFGIMLHELVHAACGPRKPGEKSGHGKDFKALGLKVGLEGKPKVMWPKDEVVQWFMDKTLAELGWYPHKRLEPDIKEKPQSTRMLKVQCNGTRQRADGQLETRLAHDDYTLRGSKSQLERGVPLCPICGQDMTVDWPKKEKNDDD
jgi:hypothetical protein